MKKTYDGLGQPGIFRNDRFWLAGDHVVDPRVMTEPRIEPLVKASDWAKKNFKMTENQGMNVRIFMIIKSRRNPSEALARLILYWHCL
jgi:hypothetical protein